MRLIDIRQCDLDVGRIQLFDTEGKDPPSYCILSHRWQPEEVVFADLEKNPKSKQGYVKVANTIRLAIQQKYNYIWIDSCCIDKSSSAELSEAINSMWTWYCNAAVCFVYLCDVVLEPSTEVGPSAVELTDFGKEFTESVWFSRGWTLQELLAPKRLLFYNSSWTRLGDENSLQELLSNASGISTKILAGEQKVHEASIAMRMSWASERTTTRIEDIAYCLLGLFSVNMPLLYGEGRGAFIRLQEAILKDSDDYSIFSWKDDGEGRDKLHGLLAGHPAAFRHAGDTLLYQMQTRPCALTNKGLSIELEVLSIGDEKIVLLPCSRGRDHSGFVGIHIVKLPRGDGQYARIAGENTRLVVKRGKMTPLLFPQSVPDFDKNIALDHGFAFKIVTSGENVEPFKCIDAIVYFRSPSTRYNWKNVGPYESRWAKEQSDALVECSNNVSTAQPCSVKWRSIPFPAWDPGIGLAVLLRQSTETKTKLSKTTLSSSFLLLLGVREDGQMGYCVENFGLQGIHKHKSKISLTQSRQRYLFEVFNMAPGYHYGIGLMDPSKPLGWRPRDFSDHFEPISLDSPSELTTDETSTKKTFGHRPCSSFNGLKHVSVNLKKTYGAENSVLTLDIKSHDQEPLSSTNLDS